MEDCDECRPGAGARLHYLGRRALPLEPSSFLTLTPFLLTFFGVALFASHKLYPLLTARATSKASSGISSRRINLKSPLGYVRLVARFAAERAASITFATTIALSALLAELVFCEISEISNPSARKLALDATISTLLVSLIVVTPALEIHSITCAAGFRNGGNAKFMLGILLDLFFLLVWLATFWVVGQAALGSHEHDTRPISEWKYHAKWFKIEMHGHGISQGSLERIGITGISLMASLAGFAAISSIWQSFGIKQRKVADTDISRKQAGLEATTDLLAVKESRLRALERKMSFATHKSTSYMSRIFRPNSDSQELSALKLEIDGLTTMQSSLSNSLSLLQAQHSTQQQSNTAIGRVCMTTSYGFSIYCVYRIIATSITTFRRWWSPTASFASTDPVNNALALIAKLWDPTLDRAAWARQISFLLSGLMLLASFNAVLQTVLVFSRYTPTRLLQGAQQNLALLVSQICATYVVSSALLLRSNLPKEMGGMIEEALGAPLDVVFVETWFECFFLFTCAATAVGIWVSRNVVGSRDWDDEFDDDVEGGKRTS